jgi:hypothetical protein
MIIFSEHVGFFKDFPDVPGWVIRIFDNQQHDDTMALRPSPPKQHYISNVALEGSV